MNTLSVRDVACELLSLSNLDLLHQTAELAENERATTVRLLHHLNEIERRKLFLDMGYRSLFAYCTGSLHYSSARRPAGGSKPAAASGSSHGCWICSKPAR